MLVHCAICNKKVKKEDAREIEYSDGDIFHWCRDHKIEVVLEDIIARADVEIGLYSSIERAYGFDPKLKEAKDNDMLFEISCVFRRFLCKIGILDVDKEIARLDCEIEKELKKLTKEELEELYHILKGAMR
jgi:predicted restriction endonuclease